MGLKELLSRSFRHGLAAPILLLLLAVAMILAMGVRLFGMGPVQLLAWSVAWTLAVAAAARWQLPALAVLGFSCTTLRYLEPIFSIGKQLPLLLAAAVTIGCVLGLGKRFLRAASGPLAWFASPTGVFGSLLLVSSVITTARYSPWLARWTDVDSFESLSSGGIDGATSTFLLEAASLASGPLIALIILCLAGVGADVDRDRLDRVLTWLFGGILIGFGLSLLTCLGQAWIPGFPLPTRDPRWPTGLATNPGTLAMAIALLTPVLAGIMRLRSLPRWLRWVALFDLVVAVAALGPLDAKTAQGGIVLGPLILVTLLVLQRMSGSGAKKVLAGVAGLLVVGAAVAIAVQLLAVASVSDWDRFVDEMSFGFTPGRIERNRQMTLMFLEHPVAGTGVGTFALLLPDFHRRYGGEPSTAKATNHLLHMAATGGAIGLAATAWLLVAFLLPPARGALSPPSPEGSGWLSATLVAGALTALFFSNWQGNSFSDVVGATPFWMVTGVSASLCKEEWTRGFDAVSGLAFGGITGLYAIALILYI